MDKDKKLVLVDELIGSVRASILEKVGQMPEDWDGIELRQYIADKFSEVVFKDTLTGKRAKDYRNEVIVRNL